MASQVNLDTGSAVALVSEGTPIRPLLKALVRDRQMIMTATAAAEFQPIVAATGGPNEQARAKRFLARVQVVPDDPSDRARALTLTKRVGEKDKVIFGTADRLGIPTMTCDRRFVRGAAAQGVDFDVLLHDPVPLTGI